MKKKAEIQEQNLEEISTEKESIEPDELILAVGMLDYRATEKPAPIYPVLVERAQLRGKTVIEIVVAPDGSVESAVVISGHPIAHRAVLNAALKAKFAPTFVHGRRVKLSGYLTYDLGQAELLHKAKRLNDQ